MQTYRLVDCKLFHVVLEGGGGRSEIWAKSLPWAEACRELQSVLKDFVGDDYSWSLDANIIPEGPRRPWTEQTLGAYLRVLDGPKPATELLREIRENSAASLEDLLLALTGINNHMLGIEQGAAGPLSCEP